jgi:hypothetical protein
MKGRSRIVGGLHLFLGDKMTTVVAPDFLQRLHVALQDTTYGSTEGLRELLDLLLDEEVCERIDPTKIDVKGKMGLCADPERHHHMHQGAHSLLHPHIAQGRVTPIKVFGGPLLIVNGVRSEDVPLSPDASTDALGQILIGQIIGRLEDVALTFHFPCGFAARAKKTRRDVLAAYPQAKRVIRNAWRERGIPQLRNIVGLLHFDLGDGEMDMVRVDKSKLSAWLKANEGKHTHLLDVY